MKAALALAALLAGTIGAQAMSDRYLAAFLQASEKPSPAMQKVLAEMRGERPFDDIAKAGILKSAYDCLPELRAFCHDVLAGKIKGADSIIYEWGEWYDVAGGKVEALKDEAQGHVDQAADRGFNLLTNEELAAVKD